jgi:hypothetical protein
VPKGWNSLEPDLDPEYVFTFLLFQQVIQLEFEHRAHDIITNPFTAPCDLRYHSDNIMSPMFEFKLDDLLKEKKRRE